MSSIKSLVYANANQNYIIPYTGYYKLEVWGAQGGYGQDFSAQGGHSGYGGYAIGIAHLEKNQTIYAQVGGMWTTFNGGGLGSPSAGGATSITTTNRGELSKYESYKSEVLIVAGGGGADDSTGVGGSGGGYKGGDSSYYRDGTTTYVRPDINADFYDGRMLAFGGTQTAGGDGYTNGTFGAGGSLQAYRDEGHTDLGSGGGGGWYGGGSGGIRLPNFGSGGGGSGYIGNSSLLSALGIMKHMYCYNCGTSQTNNSYRTTVGFNHSETATADYAKEGAGVAKITWMGDKL